MSHKPLTFLLLGGSLLASLLVSPAAHAENDYTRPGWYVGAGMGFGWQNFSGNFPDPRTDLDADIIQTGLGAEFWGGYRILSFLAAELQLEYLDRFNSEHDFIFVSNPNNPGDPASFEANFLTVGGNIKVYVPTQRIQPFIVVGVGFTRAHVTEAYSPAYVAGNPGNPGDDQHLIDFSARLGAGVDFYESPTLSIGATATYVLMAGELDGLDYISLALGVQYRF